jgi:DNA-directed RNA polymerase subunit omega
MTSQLLEEAAKIIPSTPVLINVVSRRVRQLSHGHRPMIEAGPRMGFSDIALKEIIDGKLTFADEDGGEEASEAKPKAKKKK